MADLGRAAEQVSLGYIATFALQEIEFGAGFDALRQHRQAKPAPKPQHGANDGRGLRVGIDRLDERTVDLDLVERKGAQIRERGIAGPEIVHGNANTERLD